VSGIELEEILKEFPNGVRAVDGVSLTIEDGEFVVLVGPSGCGKTTLLRCIAGLEEVTDGVVMIGDRDVTDVAPKDRDIAMVFQNYALYPHMTVRKNIAFGLNMQRRPKAEVERKVDEALAIVRLSEQGHKLPGQLSGGQQQRVAIARAIVIEPPLVLMDEPLSNLDAQLRLEMRAEIRRIHELIGSATIYVTHDQEEALSLADRIVVMKAGEVRQVGTPEDLYARPTHPDVAEFMGYRNQIHSRVVKSGNQLNIIIGGVSLAGTPVETIADDDVVAAIRPDDLKVSAAGAISVKVESAQYHGHDFYCSGRAGDGTELYFRSGKKVQKGETVRLAADPSRVLVYSRAAS
jgi:putative spermidine/putrescine transport system ATP-binding protein